MTEAGAARVHLYCIETAPLPHADVAAFAVCLDAAERARADRLPAEARRDVLVAHGLARLALTRAVPARAPADWRFRLGPHGKPEPEDAPGLHVSLSHTRGLALAGVSQVGPLGVDAEAVEAAHAQPETAAVFCAAPELAAWAALEPAARTEAFFALWTLKESLLKASGLGLSLDPRAVRCGLAPLRVEAFPIPATGTWQSWTGPAATRFRLALSLDAGALPVTVRCLSVASAPDMTASGTALGQAVTLEQVPHVS